MNDRSYGRESGGRYREDNKVVDLKIEKKVGYIRVEYTAVKEEGRRELRKGRRGRGRRRRRKRRRQGGREGE